jgi:hypothetical protein
MDSSAVSSIKEILVEHWDNAFHVLERGSSLDIYVELENKVPPGYIEGFVKESK